MYNIISIGSAIVASVSALIAYLSFRDNKKSYQLTQTPIILPTIQQVGNLINVSILNDHKTGIMRDLLIIFKNGRLTRDISKSDSLLPPNTKTDIIGITESLDGCAFELGYSNFFDQKIIITGTVSRLTNGIFDLQNLKLKINDLID